MSSRCTLVTGAAGFAGSHLLDCLSRQGVGVIGWYRPDGAQPRTIAGVRWQAVDMLNRTAVREAIRATRPDDVYHCAGAAHVGQAWDTTTTTLATNVLTAHHLVEALRDFSPEARVLNTSSALVYAPRTEPINEDHPLGPDGPYGLSKLAQELVGWNNDGGPAVHLARPFNHFGPRQHPSFVTSGFACAIAQIEAGRAAPEIPVGNLEPLRDLTDVRDTVRAYQLILEHGVAGRPYNVCRGQVIKVGDLLQMMLARARVPIRIVIDPARYRPNDSPVVQGDFTRIREELGWMPAVPLEQTIDDLLEFWRARARAT